MHASRIVTCLVLLLACVSYAPAQVMSIQTVYNTEHLSSIRLLPAIDSEKVVNNTAELTLYVLLSPECPLSQGYSLTLNKIDSEFNGSVLVTGIIPGKAYPVLQVSSFATDYALRFPLYIDPEMELTRYLHGTVTPEVILINKKGEEIYRGAIDDWAVELGKKKKTVSDEYARNAIVQYLRKETVRVRKVKPTGCLLNKY